MKTKRILAIILTLIMILGTSTTMLADEPTIYFGGMRFTRTEFIETFPDGAMIGGDMVNAEVFFDYFFTAQNNGLVASSPPTNQAATVAEEAEEREIIPVFFEELTLLTSEEIQALIETAPAHHNTRSANNIPNRRIANTELEIWIEEYAALGGINAFELEVIRLINEIREENGLNPLMINQEISMAARFHSQESAEDRERNGVNTFGHTSPINGSPSDRAYMFSHRNQAFTDNWSVLENLGGRGFNSERTPENHLQGWLNSSMHRVCAPKIYRFS